MKRALALLVGVVVLPGILLSASPSRGASSAIPLPAESQVLFVGDSITAGLGTWNPATDSWVARWTSRVCGSDTACRGRIRFNALSGRCLVATTCNGTPLVTAWQSEVLNQVPRPTTVVVEMGVNDLGKATTDQLATAYRTVMFTGIDAGIKVILSTIPPSTSAWSRHTVDNPQRQSVNGWLRGYWGDANLFDLDALMRIGSSGEADPNYFILPSGGDGLHPSSWGAVCMSDWLAVDRIV